MSWQPIAARETPGANATAQIRLLAASQLISRAGSNGAILAVQYLLFTRTHSSVWVSVSLIVTMVTRLLAAPSAGLLADRFDRKRVMMASELAGVGVWTVAVFVTQPAALVALAAASTITQSPLRPAATGTISRIVAPDKLGQANAALARADSAGLVIGPPLAGALILLLSSRWMFSLNALSFAVSFQLLRRLRGEFGPLPHGARREDRGGMQGFRYLRKQSELGVIAAAAVGVLASSGLVNVAEPQLAVILGGGALGYGLLSGGWALGSLLGAQIAARPVPRASRERLVMVKSLVFAMLATALLAPVPSLALAVCAMVVMGVGMGIFFVGEVTFVQRHTPDHLIGRVFAAVDAVGSCAFVAGAAASAIVIPMLGVRDSYAVSALLLGAAAIPLARLAPGLRRRGDEDPGDAVRQAEQIASEAQNSPPSMLPV